MHECLCNYASKHARLQLLVQTTEWCMLREMYSLYEILWTYIMINYMTVVLSIIQLAAFLIHSERVSPAFRMDRAAVSCSFGSWGFYLLPNTRTFFFLWGNGHSFILYKWIYSYLLRSIMENLSILIVLSQLNKSWVEAGKFPAQFFNFCCNPLYSFCTCIHKTYLAPQTT